MATKYYMRVNIESMGPKHRDSNGILSMSWAGHMWYEIYKVDSSGNISDGKEAGYTPDGIVTNDGNAYMGTPAFISQAIEISSKQYDILKDFRDIKTKLAENNGFGQDDYNVLTNSCIDYTWKALELIGLETNGFEGDLYPLSNADNITKLINEVKNSINYQNLFDNFSQDYINEVNRIAGYDNYAVGYYGTGMDHYLYEVYKDSYTYTNINIYTTKNIISQSNPYAQLTQLSIGTINGINMNSTMASSNYVSNNSIAKIIQTNLQLKIYLLHHSK